MAHATARTVSLHGALGHLIDVQADVSPGQVGLLMVGRPDQSLREGADRARMAIVNSGLGWPATKKITVLLSPADLTKRGPHYDLPVAVAILAADGTLPPRVLDGTAFVGELTLSGGLRSVPGVLPMTLAAADRGIHTVFVPEPQVYVHKRTRRVAPPLGPAPPPAHQLGERVDDRRALGRDGPSEGDHHHQECE